MLQRIQTIWLLLAGVAAFLTLKLPFYTGIQATTTTPYQELNAISGGIPILLLTIAIGVLALVSIGLYKNRTTQLRLSVVAVVLEAVLIFLYYQKVSSFTQGTLAFAAILHICIILFFVLAANGINKDEKLIKESDRLR